MSTKIDEFGGWKGLFLYTLLSATISGAVIGGILKWLVDKELESWKAQRSWQSAALAEVIAPAVMHFERTKSLAARYSANPRYGEAILLRDSNGTIRELLLSKAHLLPTELLAPAQCLLTHYDIWLKRFDLTLAEHRDRRGNSEPDPNDPFDVGFSQLEDATCGNFPDDAPQMFLDQFNLLRNELYELDAIGAAN